jgi:hypothetical protein
MKVQIQRLGDGRCEKSDALRVETVKNSHQDTERNGRELKSA